MFYVRAAVLGRLFVSAAGCRFSTSGASASGTKKRPNLAPSQVAPNGIISTVAGSALGNAGSSGDGGLAINALLRQPSGLAVDAFGNLFIVDAGNAVIREVNSSGYISTIARTLGMPAAASPRA